MRSYESSCTLQPNTWAMFPSMTTRPGNLDPPAPPPRVSAVALWTMRLLALAGLGVGCFLLYVHIAPWLTDTPFCSLFTWLDCDAVISHPRWSKWLGLPVSVPAVVLYAVVAGVLLTMSPRRAGDARRRWWVLSVAAGFIALAALWFIGIQVGVIGRICTFCMVEHAIGLVLAFLIWVNIPPHPSGTIRISEGATDKAGSAGLSMPDAQGRSALTSSEDSAYQWHPDSAELEPPHPPHHRRSPLPRLAAPLLALLAVGVLIGGQLLYRPDYTRSIVGTFSDTGYTEHVGDGPAAVFQNGQFTLDPNDHLLIGSPDADRFIVEAVDYTCPLCRELAGTLHEAMERLGPDYAVIVLPFPLDEDCNPLMNHTGERHRNACALAKLAYAVWLTDPAAFPAFHRWLFEHQEEMTPLLALEKAEELVDPALLGGNRVNPDVQRLLERNIRIGQRLGVRRLPGLFVADRIFTGFPEDPEKLAEAIRAAFEDRGE